MSRRDGTLVTTTQPTSDEIRVIDNGAAPTRFARGWHCLGISKDFRDGKPHSVEAFGTKLVVFADGHGTLKILDAYCRHMGGDLSQGSIKGDEVACPFHDWRWGGDGRCKKVPYARRVRYARAPTPGPPWSKMAYSSSGTIPRAIRRPPM